MFLRILDMPLDRGKRLISIEWEGRHPTREGDAERAMGTTERKTVRLTGTAVLAALAVVFDYALKFSGLKIPFPWMPFLKFDFTGVPIVTAFLMFDLTSGTITSIVAVLGIIARSGDLVGGAMKGIAEVSTVTGLAGGRYLSRRLGLGTGPSRFLSCLVGVALRITIMSV